MAKFERSAKVLLGNADCARTTALCKGARAKKTPVFKIDVCPNVSHTSARNVPKGTNGTCVMPWSLLMDIYETESSCQRDA